MSFEPITTLIITQDGRRPATIQPEPGSEWELFPVQDPWGIRRAVNPIFVEADTDLVPMGCGFHADLSGAFVTAEHVVEQGRPKLGTFGNTANRKLAISDGDPRIVAMLGGITGWGTFKLPDWALVRADEVWVSIKRQELDPLAELQGRPDSIVAADFAALQFPLLRPTAVATLPVRVSGHYPQIGETVLALGFPKLVVDVPVGPGRLSRLSEGMHASYGTVLSIHPQGRDRANPGPCIEIEADWPPGMSGGPVLNRAGEVIGIVSRSLRASGGHPGVGWATCFALAPWLQGLMPSVHPTNPVARVITVRQPAPPSDRFSGPETIGEWSEPASSADR